MYTGSFMVATSQQVNAVALAANHSLSAPATPANYTINVPSANVMWANMPGQFPCYEGFPIFKNRIRECYGFQPSSGSGYATLNAQGWPSEDFYIPLFIGSGAGGGVGAAPQWVAGTYSCGFIGNGLETIAGFGGATVSSVVHGSGGAYTTFNLAMPSPAYNSIFGFKVTGTGGSNTTLLTMPTYANLYGNTYVSGANHAISPTRGQTQIAPKDIPVGAVYPLAERANPYAGAGNDTYYWPNTWDASPFTGFKPANAAGHSQLSIQPQGNSPTTTFQFEGSQFGVYMLGSDASGSSGRPQFTLQQNFGDNPVSGQPAPGPVLFTGSSVVLHSSIDLACKTWVGAASSPNTTNSPYIQVFLGLIPTPVPSPRSWELDIALTMLAGSSETQAVHAFFLTQGPPDSYSLVIPFGASPGTYATFTSGTYQTGTFATTTFSWSINYTQMQAIISYMLNTKGFSAFAGMVPEDFTLFQTHINAEQPNISTISMGWNATNWSMSSSSGSGGGGATNIFAYLPAYNSNTTIDNPLAASAFTAEAISHFNQYGGLRWMSRQNVLNNTQMGTSTNRLQYNNTTKNVQTSGSRYGTLNVTLTANITGANSATLTSWPLGNGTFALGFNNGAIWRVCTILGTTATILGAAVTTTSTTTAYGFDNWPMEWAASFCIACGVGLWINQPALEDGTNYAAGSWSQSVLQWLDTNWPSSAPPVIFELGDELWANNPSSEIYNALAALYVPGTYTSNAAYLGYRLHTFSQLAQSTLSTLAFGTNIKQVWAWQALVGSPSSTNVPAAMVAAYSSFSNDVQYMANAPYFSANLTSGMSVAQVQAAYNNLAPNLAGGKGCDCFTIMAIHYGANYITYEGGDDIGGGDGSGVPNSGPAKMNSGFTAAMEACYTAILNAGATWFTQFEEGASTFGTGSSQVDYSPGFELTNNWSLRNSSPTFNAISSFFNGFTPTRNVVTTPGAVIAGSAYADNNSGANGNFNLTKYFGAPFLQAGYCAYLVYSATNRSSAVAVTFSGVSGSPTSQFWCNGTEVASSVSVSNGSVSMGTCSLVTGWNYVAFGKNGAQTATITQVTFN